MIDIERIRAVYNFGKEITLADAQRLLKSTKLETAKKKTILFEQGSRDTKLYYLRKGLVRMYHIKDNGDEITFNLIPENHIVANFDFIATGKPSKFYFETIEDCSFFGIDYQVLDGIIGHTSKLESNRKHFLRKVIFDLKDRIESFVLMNPEERYRKFIKDYPDLTNRVPDKYIAHMLGITPVSLSRIRNRIKSKV
jgi:CRP-like cAMP-binding protein